MRRILLNCRMAAGDMVVLSGVIRDLMRSHPDLEICVNSNWGEIWQHNPNVSKARVSVLSVPSEDQVEMGYDYKDRKHIVECFRIELEKQMGLQITRGPDVGEVYLSEEELSRPRPIAEPYWVAMAGGKLDITTKWWPYYQNVVDLLEGKIQFVQCGRAGADHHPPLKNVLNRVGETGIRDFLLLLYHADGVLSPVTFAMHAYAALPTNPERPKRGVVLHGGREELSLTQYPHNVHLHTLGRLECCRDQGCMKSWSHLDRDGPINCVDRKRLGGTNYAKCMTMIDPRQVVDEILSQMEKRKCRLPQLPL
jgi:ADP-heptose:LPS heptosyltransferase